MPGPKPHERCELTVGTVRETLGRGVDASLIRADVNPAKRLPGDQTIDWPEREKASRAVREYLSTLDEELADAPPGGRKRQPPMAISVTDPQAAWVTYRRVRSIFAYHANYLIDHKLGVIVDAEGNRANRIDENRAALGMLSVPSIADAQALKAEVAAGRLACLVNAGVLRTGPNRCE